MNIFGDFYDNTLKLQASKKEQRMQAAEDWSAAILSGSNDKIQLEEPIKSRIYYLLALAFLLLGAVMISRLAYLQIITGERNSLLASGNRIRNNAIAAPRGAIYDRNG